MKKETQDLIMQNTPADKCETCGGSRKVQTQSACYMTCPDCPPEHAKPPEHQIIENIPAREYASELWFPEPEETKKYGGEIGYAKDVIHRLLDIIERGKPEQEKSLVWQSPHSSIFIFLSEHLR